MSISEKRKVQAIISEHYLDVVKVLNVTSVKGDKSLFLTISNKLSINKIVKMIKQITSLVKVRFVCFRIEKPQSLIFDAVTNGFYAYEFDKVFGCTVMKYMALSKKLLMLYLKYMQESESKV